MSDTTKEDLVNALTSFFEDDVEIITPNRVTEEDMPWTVLEVEHVIANSWEVIRKMPNSDIRMLQNSASQVDVVRSDAGDHGGAEEEDRSKDLEGRIKISAPGHHIDQLEDVFQWIMWVRNTRQRLLIWEVARFTNEGYARMPWGKIARRVGVKVTNTGNRKSDVNARRRRAQREYGLAVRSICRRLNETGYPRRLPAKKVPWNIDV